VNSTVISCYLNPALEAIYSRASFYALGMHMRDLCLHTHAYAAKTTIPKEEGIKTFVLRLRIGTKYLASLPVSEISTWLTTDCLWLVLCQAPLPLNIKPLGKSRARQPCYFRGAHQNNLAGTRKSAYARICSVCRYFFFLFEVSVYLWYETAPVSLQMSPSGLADLWSLIGESPLGLRIEQPQLHTRA